MKFAVFLIVSCLFVGSISAENQWKFIETVVWIGFNSIFLKILPKKRYRTLLVDLV